MTAFMRTVATASFSRWQRKSSRNTASDIQKPIWTETCDWEWAENAKLNAPIVNRRQRRVVGEVSVGATNDPARRYEPQIQSVTRVWCCRASGDEPATGRASRYVGHATDIRIVDHIDMAYIYCTGENQLAIVTYVDRIQNSRVDQVLRRSRHHSLRRRGYTNGCNCVVDCWRLWQRCYNQLHMPVNYQYRWTRRGVAHERANNNSNRRKRCRLVIRHLVEEK